MAQRYDRGTLQPAQKRADGTIVVDAHLTRTGVFAYRNADGSERREYRPPAEVFRADSLASFAFVPVTNDHPPEMVSAANARQYAVGSVGEQIRQDGDHVAAKIVVYDAATVAAMTAGKRDVSCGYECDLVEEPGLAPDGSRYDAIQTNIIGNHLAIVAQGRAGTARVRMDAAYQTDAGDGAQETQMADEKKADHAVELIASEKSRADVAESKFTTEKARADGLQAKLDAAVEELAALKKQRADAEAAVPARVAARVALETAAAPILKDVKLDALDDRAIRAAVIEKVTGVKVEAIRSDAYVEARYDAALERAASSSDAYRKAQDVIDHNRVDAGSPDAGEAAKQEARKAAKNLFIAPGATK